MSDIEPLTDLQFAEAVVRQWGYWIAGPTGGYWTGGLSTLQEAFDILGWSDPHPSPESCCDEPDCWEQATCGWPSRPGGTGSNGGYRRTCGEHMELKRLPEAIAEDDRLPGDLCACGHRRDEHINRDVYDVVGWPCLNCRSERCRGFVLPMELGL